MRQRNIKKHFKFHNLSEIFYCGMTRLRNANLSVFMQCQYTKIILKRKNIGQSLLKKHSKIRNFDEIFYCGLTRLKNTNLDDFIKCQYTRAILRKKDMGQSLFNPTQDGLFRGCSRMGGGAKRPPSLKSVTHILQS